MYKAHVPGVECGRPLAAVAGVDGSGQLLQRPLVVGIELVGQGEMQLLGAGLHGAVCEITQTRHLDPDVRTARPGSRHPGRPRARAGGAHAFTHAPPASAHSPPHTSAPPTGQGVGPDGPPHRGHLVKEVAGYSQILRRSRKAEGIETQLLGAAVCGPSICKLIDPTIDSNLLHPPGCACDTVA